jgi:hypothetical protein
MEDNEFEEVTIISHTSGEPSDYTFAKALDILTSKTNIEISQTVSVDTNNEFRCPLKCNSATYLDKIHRSLFQNKQPWTIFFLGEDRFSPSYQQSNMHHRMMVGTNQDALLVDPKLDRAITITPSSKGSVYYLFYWGDLLFEFRSEMKVKIYQNGVLVHQTKSIFDGVTNQHVKFTKHHLYFFNNNWWLIRLDRSFHEMVIVKQRIQDFEVDTNSPTKDELVTVLDHEGCVTRKTSSATIPHNWDDGEFDTIKETYSSQYLICEGDRERLISKVHLLRVSDLKLLDSLVLPGNSTEMTVALRLTAPKRGIGMFLLERDKVIYLGGIYRNKLYNVSLVRMEFTILWMAYVAGDWLIVGADPQITSLSIKRL